MHVQLGAALRFVYPTDDPDPVDFRAEERNLPPGGFLDLDPAELQPRRQAQNFLEAARVIRDADFDLLLAGDRHAMPVNAFSPVPLIARLMSETGDMALGCLFLAPFYNPILLAEQIGTLAAFATGPFTAAFAIGDTEAQFAAFNMALKSRTVRTDEVVELVRRLLNGERVTFDGKYHRLQDVTIGPKSDSSVRIWVGGRRGAAVERAGRMGDGWVTDTRTDDDELQAELARYIDTARRFGRPAKPILRRNIYVGDSDAEAASVVKRILEDSYRGLTPERVLHGSPERVTEQLLAYGAMGFEMTIVRHLAGDHGRMLDSVRRIGERVIPALRLATDRRAGWP